MEREMMMQTKPGRIINKRSNIPAPFKKYNTWYEFKKDLEFQFGHPILNQSWLRIKPKTALPWNKSQIQSALSKLNSN